MHQPARLILMLLGAVWIASCDRHEPAVPLSSRPVTVRVRPVRVLIARKVAVCRIRGEGLTIQDDTGRTARAGSDPTAWIEIYPQHAGGFRIGTREFSGPHLQLAAREPAGLTLSFRRGEEWDLSHTFAGRVELSLSDTSPPTLDAVNHVDLETYVGCVVPNEVWPHFETEAFRAQAIIARTFVLYQMSRREGRSYDVASTQSSQVYRGLRGDEAGERGRKAAAYTRGVVCTHEVGGQDRLFATYYHAVCGGVTLPGRAFGPADDIPPLAGDVPCTYCRIAPGTSYRWGPVEIETARLLASLAERDRRFRDWNRIRSLEVGDRSKKSRPVTLRLESGKKARLELPGTTLRTAVGTTRMPSTFCRYEIRGKRLLLTQGRGFGHGVGLCQWGMQGQALEGKTAAEILHFYYPGMNLLRAY